MQRSLRSRHRHPLLKLVVLAVLAGQVAFTAAQLVSVALSKEVWLADLANFIRLHLLIVAVGLGIVGFLLPDRKTKVGGAFAVAAGIFPYLLLPPQAAYLGGTQFTLVSANVLVENQDPSRFLSNPDVTNADILVLQEITPLWQSALIERGEWAFDNDRDLFGSNDMKVMSRFPILDERAVSPESTDTGGRHARRLELSIEGRTVIVYAVHPQTPRRSIMWRERAAYLRDLQTSIKTERADAAVIVAGDWNTPTWSPYLRDLLDDTGYRTTEPPWWPLPTRFSIRFWSITQLGSPVDRIVLSPNVGLEEIRTGPNFGSDHLPVITRLSIP